jgi:integration host factor subunit beta
MLTNGDGPVPNNGAVPAVLTKTELIEEVSRITKLPRKEAAMIVEHILDSMVHALDRGDKVEIRGFGSFHTRPRRARVGRNPKTGARVEVPARRVPFFKPSKELRELVMKL